MKTNAFMTRGGETYSAPELNVISIAAELGFATSFPGGDVNPLSLEYDEDPFSL